ncbi:hypothetical protein M0R45_005357 [Rubus argutus]|uniref:Uncharacterized protein n=1 Tax=Rubus argutus TaxID=59490 RepID=A0AAW1YML4_RUBAR
MLKIGELRVHGRPATSAKKFIFDSLRSLLHHDLAYSARAMANFFACNEREQVLLSLLPGGSSGQLCQELRASDQFFHWKLPPD